MLLREQFEEEDRVAARVHPSEGRAMRTKGRCPSDGIGTLAESGLI